MKTKMIDMTTARKTAFAAILAIAIGIAIFESQKASRARSELASLHREPVPTSSIELDDLRQSLITATNQLDSAREENEALKRQVSEVLRLRGEIGILRNSASEVRKAAEDTKDSNPVQVAMKTWLNRVDQLRQRFDALPAQKIPEFQLLTDDDWLAASKTQLVSEEDYRRAMSNLRSIAENKSAELLQTALRKYRDANSQKDLTDIAELQPFLESPMDQTILQRYSIFPPDIIPSVRVGGDWVISQRAAVDPEFDMRFVIGASGGRGSAPFKGEGKKAH